MEHHGAERPAIFRKTLLCLLDDYERLVHEAQKLPSSSVKSIRHIDACADMGAKESKGSLPSAKGSLPSWAQLNEAAGDGCLLEGCHTGDYSLDANSSGSTTYAQSTTPEQWTNAFSSPEATLEAEMEESVVMPMDIQLQRSPPSFRSNVDGPRMERSRRRVRKMLRKRIPSGSFARTILREWLDDPRFERLIGLIIFANVVFMGVCADYEVKHLDHDVQQLPGSATVELIFCLLYTLELSLKLFVWRRQFFEPPERGWNIFDMMLVLQSIYEQVMFASNLSTAFGNIAFLRSMRLMKMLKMLRVIRLMRSMFELRILLTSIMGSLKSMFWALLLLIGVLYMFSLVLVQASANYLQSETDGAGKADLLDNWGSVLRAMKSLYLCSFGGTDWEDVAEPLLNISFVFFLVFCLYIAFFTFVIMNTMTALFVEATIKNSNKDYQANIQTEMEKKEEYIDKLLVLFEQMDSGDGLITMDQFSSRMSDPRMQAFANTLGIEISDTSRFFSLLSDNGKKPLDLDTFVTGCIRMKGQALNCDLQDLLAMQSRMSDEMGRRLNDIRQRVMCMDRFEDVLEEICNHLLTPSVCATEHTPLNASISYVSSRRLSNDQLTLGQIKLASEDESSSETSLGVQGKTSL